MGDAYFADQSRRPDFVLEVLGFKTTKGQNLLASEQKRRDSEIMRVKHGRLQRQGLTKQQAADQINDPCLKLSMISVANCAGSKESGSEK